MQDATGVLAWRQHDARGLGTASISKPANRFHMNVFVADLLKAGFRQGRELDACGRDCVLGILGHRLLLGC